MPPTELINRFMRTNKEGIKWQTKIKIKVEAAAVQVVKVAEKREVAEVKAAIARTAEAVAAVRVAVKAEVNQAAEINSWPR